MSRKYKFHDNDELYYITLTVVNWVGNFSDRLDGVLSEHKRTLALVGGVLSEHKRTLALVGIEHGFQVSKLSVKAFNPDGIPLDFTKDTTVTCNPYCYEYASSEEYHIINGDASVFVDSCDFKPQKTIYFDKQNEQYEWFFMTPYQPEIRFDLFPIKFIPGSWYEISNICNSTFYIYFFVNSDGTFTTDSIRKW